MEHFQGCLHENGICQKGSNMFGIVLIDMGILSLTVVEISCSSQMSKISAL